MNRASSKMDLAHYLLRAYQKAPDHISKLRVYNWLRHSAAMRYTTIRTNWGAVNLDLADYLQHEIFVNACYEPHTFQLFNSLIQRGARVVDVGANIGQYALSAGHLVGITGKVVAIEPNPIICQKLIDNRRLNCLQDRVEIVLAAVGSGNRLLDFGIPSFANLGATRPRRDPTHEAFWTSVVSLARLVADFDVDDVHVVKVDVEGADIDVIKSLFDQSPVRPKNIIFEYIPDSFDYGISKDHIIDYFEEYGYDLKLVTGENYRMDCDVIEFNLWATKNSQ